MKHEYSTIIDNMILPTGPAGPLEPPDQWQETMNARRTAHEYFDRLWQGGDMTRGHAYRVLCQLMGMRREQCHFARFDRETCERAIERLKPFVEGLGDEDKETPCI